MWDRGTYCCILKYTTTTNNKCCSSFGCHIADSDLAPGLHVRKMSGGGADELAHLGLYYKDAKFVHNMPNMDLNSEKEEGCAGITLSELSHKSGIFLVPGMAPWPLATVPVRSCHELLPKYGVSVSSASLFSNLCRYHVWLHSSMNYPQTT